MYCPCADLCLRVMRICTQRDEKLNWPLVFLPFAIILPSPPVGFGGLRTATCHPIALCLFQRLDRTLGKDCISP